MAINKSDREIAQASITAIGELTSSILALQSAVIEIASRQPKEAQDALLVHINASLEATKKAVLAQRALVSE